MRRQSQEGLKRLLISNLAEGREVFPHGGVISNGSLQQPPSVHELFILNIIYIYLHMRSSFIPALEVIIHTCT